MQHLTFDQAETVQLGLFATALRIIGPKRRDYSGDLDPYRNLRSSAILGVEPWRGALVRLLDKVSRLARLAEKGGTGEVSEESIIDTAADLLNYAAIALGLIIEALPEPRRRELLERLADAATAVRGSTLDKTDDTTPGNCVRLTRKIARTGLFTTRPNADATETTEVPMNAEELWHTEVASGRQPTPSPILARDYTDHTFPTRLALAIALGLAGHRSVRNPNGTTTWHWPRWPGEHSWDIPDDISRLALKTLRQARIAASRTASSPQAVRNKTVEILREQLRHAGAPWSLLDWRVARLQEDNRLPDQVRTYVTELIDKRNSCLEEEIPTIDARLCEIALLADPE